MPMGIGPQLRARYPWGSVEERCSDFFVLLFDDEHVVLDACVVIVHGVAPFIPWKPSDVPNRDFVSTPPFLSL